MVHDSIKIDIEGAINVVVYCANNFEGDPLQINLFETGILAERLD